MIRLAILGAGSVGSVLGRRLREHGHHVRWGVRNPADPKYQDLDTTDIVSAVEGADIVFLAVPWSAAEETIQSAGDLSGKILVDIINPIARDFSDLIDLGHTSAAEKIAGWTPGASVVKAFNTIGHDIMANPLFGSERATLLVAADDADAKATVMDIAEELGFSPTDAGPLRMARHLESFAWIWINLAMKQGHGREIVFHLLKR